MSWQHVYALSVAQVDVTHQCSRTFLMGVQVVGVEVVQHVHVHTEVQHSSRE